MVLEAGYLPLCLHCYQGAPDICQRCGAPGTLPLKGRRYCRPCYDVVSRCFCQPEPIGSWRTTQEMELELRLLRMVHVEEVD